MHHFTTLDPSTINLNVYFYAVTQPTEGLTTVPVDITAIYASQVRRVAVQLLLGQLDGRDYEQRLHSVARLLKSTFTGMLETILTTDPIWSNLIQSDPISRVPQGKGGVEVYIFYCLSFFKRMLQSIVFITYQQVNTTGMYSPGYFYRPDGCDSYQTFSWSTAPHSFLSCRDPPGISPCVNSSPPPMQPQCICQHGNVSVTRWMRAL